MMILFWEFSWYKEKFSYGSRTNVRNMEFMVSPYPGSKVMECMIECNMPHIICGIPQGSRLGTCTSNATQHIKILDKINDSDEPGQTLFQ